VYRKELPQVSQPFEHLHEVRTDEIDALGRASNVAYIAWMIDAATRHSAALGWPPEAYLERGAGWVVRSHAIEYRSPAFAGDVVVVRTWVATMDRASSVRRYEIGRPEGGAVLATAETKWAFIDFRTGRPTRIPRDISETFQPLRR
jgi:acyl-CoA thioester hydrolase